MLDKYMLLKCANIFQSRWSDVTKLLYKLKQIGFIILILRGSLWLYSSRYFAVNGSRDTRLERIISSSCDSFMGGMYQFSM